MRVSWKLYPHLAAPQGLASGVAGTMQFITNMFGLPNIDRPIAESLAKATAVMDILPGEKLIKKYPKLEKFFSKRIQVPLTERSAELLKKHPEAYREFSKIIKETYGKLSSPKRILELAKQKKTPNITVEVPSLTGTITKPIGDIARNIALTGGAITIPYMGIKLLSNKGKEDELSTQKLASLADKIESLANKIDSQPAIDALTQSMIQNNFVDPNGIPDYLSNIPADAAMKLAEALNEKSFKSASLGTAITKKENNNSEENLHPFDAAIINSIGG